MLRGDGRSGGLLRLLHRCGPGRGGVVAWQLKQTGYRVIMQAWDFEPGRQLRGPACATPWSTPTGPWPGSRPPTWPPRIGRTLASGGDGLVSQDRRYPLELDQAEVDRYRMMAEAARQAEADLWEPAGIVPGARVADVGCGPGAMLPALAAAVGPDGRVVAVDADPEAVAAATALVAAAGLGNVAVREGRAEETGLEVGSLEVVMLRHVLAHNGGAEDAIVAHLASLLRPGGCLYLVDADGTAIRVIPKAEHPDLVELQERYLAFRAARGDDNAAGLRLAERLVRAGLELVEFRGCYVIREVSPGLRSPAWAAREAMVAAGVATAEDLRRWDRAFGTTAGCPATFFAPVFTAVGRRPA
jgi:SAM-dependent methyltransferase